VRGTQPLHVTPESFVFTTPTGFAEFTASGERISATNWQALLARAPLACGDVGSANEVLDAAFAFAEETGERIVEHELNRLGASV
jgi:predicted ATPase